MTKAKKAARKTRRERRIKRNAVAFKVVNGLIAKTLKPAELKKLLDAFAKLSTHVPCAHRGCSELVKRRKDGADLCEAHSQDDAR